MLVIKNKILGDVCGKKKVGNIISLIKIDLGFVPILKRIIIYTELWFNSPIVSLTQKPLRSIITFIKSHRDLLSLL